MNSLYRKYTMFKIATVYSDEKNEEYELDNICIFNKDGGIFTTRAFICEELEEIKFDGKILLKRKKDFNIKDNFVMKEKFDKYTLYIYEENISWKYLGLEKRGMYIFRTYEICGYKVEQFVKNLGEKLYTFDSIIEENAKKILNKNSLVYFSENELKEIFNKIRKANNDGIKELERIEKYIPNENDFKNEV